MPAAKPVGSRRVNHKGYIQIKTVDSGRRWPFEHRVVWEAIHGPLPDGWCIHHIDGNRTNNTPDNLTAFSVSDHQSLHVKSERAREQARQMGRASKGKKLPPEHGAKISAALKGKKKSPEHRALIAAATRGTPPREPRWRQSVPVTEEQRKERSERMKRFYAEHPERKQEMSERMRSKWAHAKEAMQEG